MARHAPGGDEPPPLPRPGAPWAQVEAFAGTVDGYAYAESIGEEGPPWFESWWARFNDEGALPADSDALRALLALAVRRIRWLSWGDTSALVAATRPLADAILARLNATE